MNKLNVRWLGKVSIHDSSVLQQQLIQSDKQYLLLLEHPNTYTLGSLAVEDDIFPDALNTDSEIVPVDRGGKVTFHGPGQLVGYPIISLPEYSQGISDGAKYSNRLEEVIINVLSNFGIIATRKQGLPGIWVNDNKICAIGSKIINGRTKHGFALNIFTNLEMFNNIIPCGITDFGVTNLVDEIETDLSNEELLKQSIEYIKNEFVKEFSFNEIDYASAAWRDVNWNLENIDQSEYEIKTETPAESSSTRIQLKGRLSQAGVYDDTELANKRPSWMKIKATVSEEFTSLKKLVKDENLHTVCEEAGCPNINECWSQGTATFMILGSRCTRACAFCLIDTRKPLPVDEEEPLRVATSVAKLNLKHAVITCVTRDDLPDGGAKIFAETIRLIKEHSPKTRVEVLISDCKGDADSLQIIFDAKPDVLNHNIETVLRLQRAMRTSANYARSLAVLARAKQNNLITKTGLILGMGETTAEVYRTIDDCAAAGIMVLTIGQYLRPTPKHAPVVKWYTPEEFEQFKTYAYSVGFTYVESGPLVRSSYHASNAVDAALYSEANEFEKLFEAKA